MSATGLAVAFAGGTGSLLSPCVLPVLPAYLSIITGLGMSAQRQPGPDAASDVTTRAGVGAGSPVAVAVRPQVASRGGPATATVLRGGLLFVTGFSVVFVALGL